MWKKSLNTEEKILEKLPEIEVVKVYPSKDKPKKEEIKEFGTCHISIKELGIDIKNISYFVGQNNTIKVMPPSNAYTEILSEYAKKRNIVHTVIFHNKEIWNHLKDVIRKEIKFYHG